MRSWDLAQSTSSLALTQERRALPWVVLTVALSSLPLASVLVSSYTPTYS